MKKQNILRIGILGLGVVGSGLVAYIRKNKDQILKETGTCLEIKKIFVRDLSKPRAVDTTGLSLTTNIHEIIDDPEIDIICECMGGSGYKETYRYVMAAIQNKKHIVLSSKKTLATYAQSILNEAYTHHIHVKYDATVGGGIPITKILNYSLNGDRLLKITGILNATSNFIYSKMSEQQLSFSEALKIAQDKGYAENNPEDDIDGFDAANKLVILSLFGFKSMIQRTDLHPVSFTGIEPSDIALAKELGYTVKPIAMATQNGLDLKYYIGPCLVPSDHILSNTSNNYNTIILEGEYCGELGFYGQGAGSFPTASAMYDDLVSLVRNDHPVYDPARYESVAPPRATPDPSKYYCRFVFQNERNFPDNIEKFLTASKIPVNRILKNQNDNNTFEIALISDVLSSEAMLIQKFKHPAVKAVTILPVI